MKLYISKKAYSIISLFFICFNSCKESDEHYATVDNENLMLQQHYESQLKACIDALEPFDTLQSAELLKNQYLEARNAFKALEPILAFNEAQSYNFLNGPNIIKTHEEDETDIKIMNPIGFQVIEEELFEDDMDVEKIRSNAKHIYNRLEIHLKNADLKHIKPYHILWIVRDQILRTALTGITGFDSPDYQRSLEEARITYSAIESLINIYANQFTDEKLKMDWINHIEKAKKSLNGDFETFDRYEFLKDYTQLGLSLWNQTVSDWQVKFPFTLALNYDIETLFGRSTFNAAHFSGYLKEENLDEKIELGEMLFFDNRLSSNKTISCASCHDPSKFYTDGKVTPIGLERNSPTLLYAGLQRAYFYDNRAGSIEGQIVSVVEHEKEFHTNLIDFQQSIEMDTVYQAKFNSTYDSGLNETNIRNAIASYVRSLSPFNSKFDRNMRGEENTLTAQEKNGFNLFMGKAACATCHFAPVFNGTVPMAFKESEMELIGVPNTKDTLNPSVDEDLGRYNLFNTENRKHFFKTPTVRNIAETGPYMHNGVYDTLEELVDFYNRGGGNGMGMELEFQTLPPDPLNLTDQEISDLIAFMETLTDSIKKAYP